MAHTLSKHPQFSIDSALGSTSVAKWQPYRVGRGWDVGYSLDAAETQGAAWMQLHARPT